MNTRGKKDKTLSVYGLRLHLLGQGGRFDLGSRRPEQMGRRAAEKLPEKQPEPS